MLRNYLQCLFIDQTFWKAFSYFYETANEKRSKIKPRIKEIDIHFGQFDFSNTANENEPKQSRVKTAKEKRLEKRMQQLAVDNFDLIFHFMFIFLFHYLF